MRVLLLLALVLPACAITGPTVGEERPAVVLEPSDWDGASPLPLIVALHGYGNSGSQITRWTGLDAAQGTLVVLPEGLVDSRGSRYWNATPDCCDFDDSGVDDVAYLLGLVDDVRADWPVDPDRIALIGHSNGGFMSYTLACEAEHPFASLVSIAGTGAWDEGLCDAGRPVSVLQVHGTRDRAQAIGGDPTGPSAQEMLRRWGQRGGCGLSLQSTGTRDYTALQPGEETVVQALDCPEGLDVGLWQMVGANHGPRFNAGFQDDVLAWMLGHRRVDR